jgi:hypothetical protein
MSAPIAKPIFYYAVYCAWCHTVTSYSTVEHSSGICLECANAMRAHARAIGILKNKETASTDSLNSYPTKRAS